MDINNKIPQALLDKLNKLKNLSEGAAAVGSLEEAANAAEKYMSLLLKHNLDEQTVADSILQKKIDMLRDDIDVSDYYAYRASDWVQKLTKVIAHHCMCVPVRVGDTTFAIVGEKVNVGVTFYLLEQIVSKVSIALQFSWTNYSGEENFKVFRRGFFSGAVYAIHKKLSEQEREIRKAEDNGLALMVVSKRKLAEEFMKQTFPSITTKTRRLLNNVSGVEGFTKGVEAGSNIDLNKGIEQTGKVRRRLE